LDTPDWTGLDWTVATLALAQGDGYWACPERSSMHRELEIGDGLGLVWDETRRLRPVM